MLQRKKFKQTIRSIVMMSIPLLLASCASTSIASSTPIHTTAFENIARTSSGATQGTLRGTSVVIAANTPGITPVNTMNLGNRMKNTCVGGIEQSDLIGNPTYTLTTVDEQNSIQVHIGDTIEIQLPITENWTMTNTSTGILTVHQPENYILTTASVCVWDFTVNTTGTTTLFFDGAVGCTPPRMCLEALQRISFPIEAS